MKKLKLKDLHVQSFITKSNYIEIQTVKGGVDSFNIRRGNKLYHTVDLDRAINMHLSNVGGGC